MPLFLKNILLLNSLRALSDSSKAFGRGVALAIFHRYHAWLRTWDLPSRERRQPCRSAEQGYNEWSLKVSIIEESLVGSSGYTPLYKWAKYKMFHILLKSLGRESFSDAYPVDRGKVVFMSFLLSQFQSNCTCIPPQSSVPGVPIKISDLQTSLVSGQGPVSHFLLTEGF